MRNYKEKIRQKRTELTSEHGFFRNENGAIDLASIMVGIIVIGLIGGVIAATVFAVIPWTQDNAAKQQLDSVVSAQSAYKGLSSTTPPSLPAGHKGNSYASSIQLAEADLLSRGPSYCTTVSSDGKGYEAFSKSSSGQIWSVSDKNTKPTTFSGTLPSDCSFILTGEGWDAAPYVDPTPTTTTLTYKCAANITGSIPLKTNLTGKETWSDGITRDYTNAANASTRLLTAGVEYKVTFEGTYKAFNMTSTGSSDTLAGCLRSVDHWGSGTGVTNAYAAFMHTTALTDVPEHIPTTITDMTYMFRNTGVLDADISKWDVSNVTHMKGMFSFARTFNQPLNDWNVSSVKDMSNMFENATVFNQPLDKWNTSSLENTSAMFKTTTYFNQPLESWNTSNVTNMNNMFSNAVRFNSAVNGWDTSKVEDMSYMFYENTVFNQPLNNWNTSRVTNLDSMFFVAQKFNQPLDKWDVSNVENMSMLFMGANAFNQNISNWDTSSVKNMMRTFASARSFNYPLNDWNTSNVTNMAQTFHDSVYSYPLDKWDTSNVESMFQMFRISKNFNQNIKGWNVSKVTNSSDFRYGSILTAENSPF